MDIRPASMQVAGVEIPGAYSSESSSDSSADDDVPDPARLSMTLNGDLQITRVSGGVDKFLNYPTDDANLCDVLHDADAFKTVVAQMSIKSVLEEYGGRRIRASACASSRKSGEAITYLGDLVVLAR